jgi:hypothetical protein
MLCSRWDSGLLLIGCRDGRPTPVAHLDSRLRPEQDSSDLLFRLPGSGTHDPLPASAEPFVYAGSSRESHGCLDQLPMQLLGLQQLLPSWSAKATFWGDVPWASSLP